MYAGTHEVFPRPSAGTVRRDDRGYYRREFIDDLRFYLSSEASLHVQSHQHSLWFPRSGCSDRRRCDVASRRLQLDVYLYRAIA